MVGGLRAQVEPCTNATISYGPSRVPGFIARDCSEHTSGRAAAAPEPSGSRISRSGAPDRKSHDMSCRNCVRYALKPSIPGLNRAARIDAAEVFEIVCHYAVTQADAKPSCSGFTDHTTPGRHPRRHQRDVRDRKESRPMERDRSGVEHSGGMIDREDAQPLSRFHQGT